MQRPDNNVVRGYTNGHIIGRFYLQEVATDKHDGHLTKKGRAQTCNEEAAPSAQVESHALVIVRCVCVLRVGPVLQKNWIVLLLLLLMCC